MIRTLAQFDGNPAVAAGWNLAGDRLAAAGGQTVKIWDGDGSTVLLDATDVHTATITLAEWSPDGRFFLTADEAGGLILWDGESGRLAHRLEGHTKPIRGVDWSPEQDRLLTGGVDKTVIVWDLTTGKAQQVIPSDVGSILNVRWHPDGQRVLMVGKESAASLWGSEGSGPLARYVLESPERIGTVAWIHDGTQLLTGDHDGRIRTWDVESGAILNFLVGHTAAVEKVLVYDGEHHFLSVGKETSTDRPGSVRLWNVGSAREIQVLKDHIGEIEDVTWGRDQSEFVSVGGDGVMRLYTTAAQLEIPAIQAAEEGRVLSAGWIDGGSRILTAGGNTAAIWDAQNGEQIFMPPHDEQIWSVRLGDDGRLLMAASANGHVHIWQIDSGKEITTLVHSDNLDIYYARWDDAGGLIVTGDISGTLGLWDPTTYELRCWIKAANPDAPAGEAQTVNTIRFQKPAGLVVTSSHNGRVTMWDSRTCAWMYELPTNFTDAYEALWNKPRTQVLAYGEGSAPLIWDAERREVVARLVDDQAPGIGAFSAAWNGDETAVLAAGSDNVVRVWDASTGKLQTRLDAHDSRITTVSWIKDGTQILTASYDKLVRISDVQTGSTLITLRGHTDSR